MTFWARLRAFSGSGGTRRQMIGTAAAGLILGLGGVTIGSSLVHASERGGLFDLLQEIFAPPRPEPAPPVHRPGRYANLPDGRHVGLPRRTYQTPRPLADLTLARTRRPRRRAERAPRVVVAATGRSTVCVRMCDGYLFPLGRLTSQVDMPVHEAACAAACPGATTSVYTLGAGETELDRAISPQGLPYRASALANIYRQRRVENCSCQAAPGTAPLPIAHDLTLRRGDVVATGDSADVVTRLRSGSVALVDYRQAPVTHGQSRRIEAKVGAIRRDADARAFRRTLRTADRASLVQVASAGESLRLPARPMSDLAEVRVAAPVRVVAPSPFR